MAHGDKRQQIIRAAERLFARQRFHEVTVADIAHTAGVGKGTVYLYFRDKEELFVETLMAGYDELCAQLKATLPAAAPFAQRLQAATGLITAFYLRRQPFWRMLHAAEGRPRGSCRTQIWEQWRRRKGILTATVAEIIQQGVECGKVRDDVSPQLLASCFLALLRTRNRLREDLPEENPDPETLLDLFLNGATSS